MRTPTLTVAAILATAAAAAQGAPAGASGDVGVSRRNATPTTAVAPTPPDPEALEAGCNAGKAVDCERLAGVHMRRGPAVAANREQAMQFYQKACDAGRATSCTHLARLYRMAHRGKADGSGFSWNSRDPLPADVDPQVIAEDEARSDALFQKACDGGHSMACTELASLVHRGPKGEQRDPVRAAELYERACELNAPRACLIVGDMYRGGKGVERDPARGLALLERGCEQGDSSSCFAAGKMYELGEGCQKDPERAQQLLAKAEEKRNSSGRFRMTLEPATPQAE